MSFLFSGLSPRTVSQISGAAAGVAASAYAFVDTQRLIWRSAAEDCRSFRALPALQQRSSEQEAFFGPQTRALVVRGWNKAIDNTLGALATELAKRGL